MRGVAAFAVALPVLLLSAYFAGDLAPDPGANLQHLRPADLTQSGQPAALENIDALPRLAPSRRRAPASTATPAAIDEGFDILSASELEAISQAR